eukprot:Nitzschia sp. Nitz4//scaffold176_size46146//26422//27093//NITZ4_007193-RA/size46146-augustus-gene-0.5-mRNA-1//-1//CDS//3329539018//8095//frame0
MRFSLTFLSLAMMAVSSLAQESQQAEAHPTLHFIHPHPLAGEPLTADNAAAILGHYGKPPASCEGDEEAFQISGVPGAVCSPKCDASGQCPTDVPDGVSARPQCALENQSTGDKYCVLICHEQNLALDAAATTLGLRGSPSLSDAQCGDATCQVVQAGLGICTYE